MGLAIYPGLEIVSYGIESLQGEDDTESDPPREHDVLV